MYVCVCAYTHLHIDIDIDIHIDVYIFTCMYVCMYVCVYIHASTFIPALEAFKSFAQGRWGLGCRPRGLCAPGALGFGLPQGVELRGQDDGLLEGLEALLLLSCKEKHPGRHILYYTILYYTILYYTILYYTILYYTILYYTILYYTILYYTILYYTILYYTILYYTILYYTILYYTILYYNDSWNPLSCGCWGQDVRCLCEMCWSQYRRG